MTGSHTVVVDDLRARANTAYPLAQPLPPGAVGLFGPAVPLGSPEYAAADAAAISPGVAEPADPIPGWRITGSLWPGERYVVRVPQRWNGRLVVAGTPSQRSEFANDRIWSDPLLARGYAYACGNKGLGEGAVLLPAGARLTVDGIALPRFPAGPLGVSFWQHAPGNVLPRWMDEFFTLTVLAEEAIGELHGAMPELTYAVGLSNGGAQVRWALERSDFFDGGLAWNAVLWTADHNLLRQLPPAVAAMDAGTPDRLRRLGFPPDVRGRSGASLYERNLSSYWRVTAWIYAMLYDPTASIPYGDALDPAAADGWAERIGAWRANRAPEIAERIRLSGNTGDLKAKLIDLASAFDHLVPPAEHFTPYAALVGTVGRGDRYRAEVIHHAQHVDAWSEDSDFPYMRPGYPRVWEAFDELVRWVEG